MPNQGNRSNGRSQSGKGQTGDATKKGGGSKPNPERSDIKQDRNDKEQGGNTSRTSNQGRKRASGGNAEA